MDIRGITVASLVVCIVGTAALADARREIHFPDLPGYLTLKCDLHTHTVFSDGAVWPTVRVDEAWREGLDAIAITDHIEHLPHSADLPKNHNRAHELALRSARQKGILLVKGAEVTRSVPPGHYNAIFINDVDPLDTPDFYDVFDRATEQKAFVFWNHPLRYGAEKGKWEEWQQTLHRKGQLHGIEVCNSDDYFPQALTYANEHGLTMIGSSDIHRPSPTDPWTAQKHRTITLVFAKERSIEGIREALVAGRTAVWHKNMLIGRETILAELLACIVEVHPPHHKTDKYLWLKMQNHSDLDIELARSGNVGPKTIHIEPQSTSLVRLKIEDLESPKSLTYEATNFVSQPDKALQYRILVPRVDTVGERE